MVSLRKFFFVFSGGSLSICVMSEDVFYDAIEPLSYAVPRVAVGTLCPCKLFCADVATEARCTVMERICDCPAPSAMIMLWVVMKIGTLMFLRLSAQGL